MTNESKIRKILIAEDSPTQALHLQMALEDAGYHVIHAKNGKEALEKIDPEDKPEIIITDIVMPEMDGYELCSKVKSDDNTKDIPVILLTQLSDPNDVIKGLQAGADNFISKPYSNEFLFERINDMLLNREIRKNSPAQDTSDEIYFAGKKYELNSGRMQILDLLLSTYYNAINKNKELEEVNIELKKVHRELKLNNVQLEKSIDEKNRLLGVAAHDLRSPLSAVASFLSLAEDLIQPNSFDGQDIIFSSMKKSLDFMLNMVSEVLDFAKIESGKLELKCAEFNMIEFLDSTINLNQMISNQKNITITPVYPKDELIVNADQNKLNQVMDNLLSNAIKYSEQGTNIKVNLTNNGEGIKVMVEDEGKGIPEAEIGKLFQPFSTTSVRATGGEKSTGLGLVSSKKIVETHGGEIWVESQQDVGSKFFFTIPKEMVN